MDNAVPGMGRNLWTVCNRIRGQGKNALKGIFQNDDAVMEYFLLSLTTVNAVVSVPYAQAVNRAQKLRQ